MAEAVNTPNPPMPGSGGQPAGWMKSPAAWLVALLLGMLAWPVAQSWLQALSVRSWQQNSVQALVVVLLAMAFFRRDVRPVLRFSPSWAGFCGMGIAGAGYLVGGLLAIKALFWGGFLLLLAMLCWTLCGFRCFYGWLGVFLFSFFLLPELPTDVKTGISLPLQLVSTRLTSLFAGLFIPISASGNIFYINGEAYEVTVACSGLHTWIGFLFAGLLWMLFERFSLKSLLALLLGVPVLAVCLNVLRLVVTALVAYHVSPDAGLAIHTNLEYLLFPLGLGLMWVAGRRLHAGG